MKHDDLNINIQHVTFRPDELVEVTYTEAHDVTDAVAVVKTIIIDSKLLDEDELVETLKTLESFVDEGLLRLRNPADTA